jgi:ABC-type branched-subunit amino acid transport system substrate-binding protein
MQDLKEVAPNVKLQMPDGFSDPGANGTVANGAYISVAGQPPKSLTGVGAIFIKSFGKQIGTEPNPYSQYGAQAMQVMLKAVAAGAGDRAKTTKSIFGLSITNGIIGNFTINATGDTNLTPITVYRQAGKKLIAVKTIIRVRTWSAGNEGALFGSRRGRLVLPRRISRLFLLWPPTSAHTRPSERSAR